MWENESREGEEKRRGERGGGWGGGGGGAGGGGGGGCRPGRGRGASLFYLSSWAEPWALKKFLSRPVDRSTSLKAWPDSAPRPYFFESGGPARPVGDPCGYRWKSINGNIIRF